MQRDDVDLHNGRRWRPRLVEHEAPSTVLTGFGVLSLMSARQDGQQCELHHRDE
jgi:hypothetical protein